MTTPSTLTRLALPLLALILGVFIGQHTAYGTAVRDHDDATYYKAMTDTLRSSLDRCVSLHEPVVHEVARVWALARALRGRVVRVETPAMTEDR